MNIHCSSMDEMVFSDWSAKLLMCQSLNTYMTWQCFLLVKQIEVKNIQGFEVKLHGWKLKD